MFTSWDKALIAGIMSIISLAVMWFGYEGYFASIREEQLATIIAILTPFLVYFIPNKTPPTSAQKVSSVLGP